MGNITITRFARGFVDGVPRPGEDWQGCIEPADKSWVMFVARDGSPVMFLNRDPDTGAVKSSPEEALPLGD